MKVDFFNHYQTLINKLPKIIILSGDEPYQKKQVLENIKKIYKSEDFELIKHSVDSKLEKSWLLQNINNLNLFYSRKLYIITFSKLPDKTTQKTLVESLTTFPQNDVFILNLPKISNKQQSQTWYRNIEKLGCHIPVWQPSTRDFIKTLSYHVRDKKINIEHEALLMITRHNEGNLLSACQTIDKISASSTEKITIHIAKQHIYNSARYNVFDLIENLLLGNTFKTLQIFEYLKKDENTDLSQILWWIAKEVRLLIKLHHCQSSRQQEIIYQNNQVWKSKQKQYHRLLNINNKKILYKSLEICFKIDLTIKGILNADQWREAYTLCLLLSQNQPNMNLISHD